MGRLGNEVGHVQFNFFNNANFVHNNNFFRFLPIKGRETQADWFGKRGLPWHITVAYIRDPTTKSYHQRFYVHVFEESVKEDATAVVAILVDTLKRIKKEQPDIKKAFLRSDNAGCYHGAGLIAAIPKINAVTEIQIKRIDFSEAQVWD